MIKKFMLATALLSLLLLGFQNCSPFAVQQISADSSGLEVVQPLSKVHPSVVISTENGVPITSKDDYVTGRLVINPNGAPNAEAFDAPMKIKGRGNSTWGMPKKPFKIKLDTKASVLGFPADKEWVLLANYSDKTLLRTLVAFELGRSLGIPYVPRTRTVEVTLNGEYLGVYVLTEQVKIAPDRVNVAALKAADVTEPNISGGYLLELDQRKDETVVFTTTRGVPYAVKEPDLVQQQITYITNYMQGVEDNLYSNMFADPSTGYAKDLEIDTFINWYLVNELFKNQDSANFSSIYFYKDRGKKLALGPLWDFDLAAGNVDYSNANQPQGWWVKSGSPWFSRLFQDPVFEARVKARWKEVKASKIDQLIPLVDRYAESLSEAQVRNFQRWNILNQYVWPNPVVTGSYEGEVNYVKTFLQQRIQWLDQEFSK